MKKNSVAEILVQEFIKGLEQWDIPRQQGWISKTQKNFVSTNPYNWFNQLLLSYISGKKGWSNYWGSYKQIKDNWGFKDWEEMYPVRIVFYKEYTKKKDTDVRVGIFFIAENTAHIQVNQNWISFWDSLFFPGVSSNHYTS